MIEQQFIEYVVKQLVDEPDAVRVERIVDDKGILLKLTVAPSDLGRVCNEGSYGCLLTLWICKIYMSSLAQ